jgi:hypothetical protein
MYTATNVSAAMTANISLCAKRVDVIDILNNVTTYLHFRIVPDDSVLLVSYKVAER